jgi:polysaccharide deacetylase 2 family uncharacterized protein YibQ
LPRSVVAVLGCLAAIATASGAVAAPDDKPLLAIIIDDLGNQRRLGMQVADLPGPVACAFMPHTPYAGELAERAHLNGKEVMLHLPMQPNEMQRIAGLGEISLDNERADLRRILASDLATVPHVVGINNHMGSLITRHPGHMGWLMDELARRGNLFFVDSYTTAHSVALAAALEHGVPAVRRHVFLDDDPEPAAIARQFARLQRQARQRGFAIGIGHPYPATLEFLQSSLPGLSAAGFQLVSIGEILRRLAQGELEQGAAPPAAPHVAERQPR